MKHETALIAVAAIGLGTVVATVAVGSRVREPTVVANPYEAGLHHGEAAAHGAARPPKVTCDLAAGPCAQRAGAWEVTLELTPRPLRTMADLAAAVTLRRDGALVDGAAVALSFEMRGMSMGENRRALAPSGGGRYAGKAVLVRCASGRRDWLATVAIDRPGEPHAAASFGFAVAE